MSHLSSKTLPQLLPTAGKFWHLTSRVAKCLKEVYYRWPHSDIIAGKLWSQGANGCLRHLGGWTHLAVWTLDSVCFVWWMKVEVSVERTEDSVVGDLKSPPFPLFLNHLLYSSPLTTLVFVFKSLSFFFFCMNRHVCVYIQDVIKPKNPCLKSMPQTVNEPILYYNDPGN